MQCDHSFFIWTLYISSYRNGTDFSKIAKSSLTRDIGSKTSLLSAASLTTFFTAGGFNETRNEIMELTSSGRQEAVEITRSERKATELTLSGREAVGLAPVEKVMTVMLTPQRREDMDVKAP